MLLERALKIHLKKHSHRQLKLTGWEKLIADGR